MGQKVHWQFRKIAAVEELAFHGVLEKFYKLGIDGLVRENIQNSLDGKISECEQPVEVRIETGIIDADKIPGIDEIKERISCLKGENTNTRETIEDMKGYMKRNEVPYISFEDRNTKGLTGAIHGEEYDQNDTWGVYAYKKGVHFFEEDHAIENRRGGSYGVGKIASNAASGLYLMFFANCDADQNRHLGGTVQLIEHTYKEKCYRATGYFSDIDENGRLYPFENQFHDIFKKDTRGLKIIIPYLRDQFCDEQQILRSVCDNFFIAILSGKLIVYLNEIEINKDTILKIVNNREYYEEQNEEEIHHIFTPLYIRTYLSCKPVKLEIRDKNTPHYFWLFFYFSEKIRKGRVAIIRGIGMKIEDKKIMGHVNDSFNAILMPLSDEEDIFLKTMENESHTELSNKHIKNQQEQSNALRFINNISRKIGEIVDEAIRSHNPSDGKMDTSDILYSLETSFQKELTNSMATVKLTKGNKKSEKLIVKVSTNGRRDKKRDENEQKDRKRRNNKNVALRKSRKKDGDGKPKSRVRYTMHPESIHRLVLKDREILHLDFSDNVQYDGEKICDISMSVIDGMGMEYEKEFQVNKNYARITDKNTGKSCEVQSNIIKNITIENQQVYLEMAISKQYNHSLKFVYYVEV